MEYQELQKTFSLYTGANDCRFWLYLHMLPQGTDNTWFSDSLPKAKMIKLYNVLIIDYQIKLISAIKLNIGC